jgi:predicted RNA binding protein YcfA (HicA-like mRNA interferase family)
VRLSRDVAGSSLARALAKLGYEIRRQTVSHIRVTRVRTEGGEHHVTIPAHDAIKVGTLFAREDARSPAARAKPVPWIVALLAAALLGLGLRR